MPVIDLGAVVGPRGPQGATGATGPTGAQGAAGPNQVTSDTSTTLTGVLYGQASKVRTITVDNSPSSESTNLITSGAVASVVEEEIITVTLPSFSSLGSWTAQGITANHVVIDCVLSNPFVQTGDWTVVTGSNTITISGSISGSTTATIRFGLQGSSINATAN